MKIIRLEERDDTNEMFSCYYENKTFGFALFTDTEGVDSIPIEFTISLDELNKVCYTNFKIEQLIKGLENLDTFDFCDVVAYFIGYSQNRKIGLYKLLRSIQELYGRVQEKELNDNEIKYIPGFTGFHQFIDEENNTMVFAINCSGCLTLIAFTLNYLPLFFDVPNSKIGLDIFYKIPNGILSEKLIEQYVAGMPIVCRPELKRIVRNYTRKRKINLALD